MSAMDFEGDDRKSKTIRERREELELTREDLAERIGFDVTADLVKRWEATGLTGAPGTKRGDFLADRIHRSLETDDLTLPDCVPTYPMPGDLVITPGSKEEATAYIYQAKQMNLRIAMVSDYGPDLLPPDHLSAEDVDRTEEQCRTEELPSWDRRTAARKIFNAIRDYIEGRDEEPSVFVQNGQLMRKIKVKITTQDTVE